MVKIANRRWLQFSLKSLLVLALFCGVMTAWISKSSREYDQEQHLIESISRDLPSGMTMTVKTNGQQDTSMGGFWAL